MCFDHASMQTLQFPIWKMKLKSKIGLTYQPNYNNNNNNSNMMDIMQIVSDHNIAIIITI